MKILKTKKIFNVILFWFILFSIVTTAFAAINTWDFSVPWDYTISDTTKINISSWIASIKKNTLAHTWVINNATTYNWAYDVVVDWIYAYMTNYDNDSVAIINISNPTSPSFVSQIVNNGWTIRLDWAAWIVKDGNYLYVASNISDALQIIDVSNPASPTAAAQVLNTTTTRLDWARGIDKVWNYVYIASNVSDALTVIDVSTPTSPTYVWKYRVNNWNLNWARDVKVVWNYAFVACFDNDSFSVVDISNPANPTYITRIADATNLDWAHHVEISWNYAYVSAFNNNSVRVIDISTPTAPTAVTNISGWSYSLSQPRDLLVDWNYLYITSLWNDAVNIADISNPASPVYVSKILHNASNPLLDGANWLFKVWDFIYVASSISDALEILRLNYDSTSPTVINTTWYNYWATNNIVTFSEILWWWNAWTTTYQISKDNWTTWYYWNGTAWATTLLWVTNSNSASVINSNLTSFNSVAWWTWLFRFKVFLTSNGYQAVEIDSISMEHVAPPKPGWVSTNLSIWLKANKWTSTTTDWAALSTWNDQSGNGFNATAWVAPTYFSTTTNLNFNPLVDFNGSTQYLQNTSTWAYSQSYFAVVVPDNQVDWTLTWWVPFAFNCNTANLNTGTCWLPFWWLVLWAFTVAINDEVITHAIWASTEWRSAQIWAASYQANKPMLINMNENAAWTGTEISEKWSLLNNYNANTYQTLSATSYRLWLSTDWANPYPYNWKIAEIINYNSRVNTTDKTKIESYLSLKYWMTLKSGTQNYLASDWTTTMWDTTTAWSYIYDIFGIGRDDDTELTQIKSKSVNSDGIITLEAIWEWTNMSPWFVDMNDKEFLTISNNNLWNTWTQTDAPAGYYNLARNWKVQETGEVWTVNLDFDVANTNFDVPVTATWSNYYFTYDTNGNWALADETPQVMTNLWWNVWRIWAVNLNNNRIFSISTQATTNNIPTNITLSNNSIDENVATNSTIWTFTTTDADSWDTHTYSLVAWAGDTDNQYFTLSWATLRLIHSPDFEIKSTYSIRVQTDDWNWWQYQKVFTININNLPEAIPSTLDFETTLDDYKYTVTSWIWARTTTNPYEWSYSMESDNLWVANSQSCFEVNNTLTQTGTISFYYNVSSQSWSDFLRFYIDNVEQQAWSWTVPWTQYTNTAVPAWSRIYKWCYIKDWAWSAWSDKAWIDFVSTQPTASWETIPPTITSINFASGTLLPGWNHTININYFDTGSLINTSSDVIALYKWNWSSWWTDISATWLNLGWKIITSTWATYTTNNLVFWKYRYDFQISDNDGNTSSTGAVFYIDQPEIIVSSWTLDIWDINNGVTKFSSWELTITVNTVWAWFNLILNKDTTITDWTAIITDWNWVDWFWYDKNPYTSIINLINTNQIIATQTWSININGNKNTYTYTVKFWALVWPEQVAWNYEWLVRFGLSLNY